MPTYAVRVLYLDDGDDWGKYIRVLTPQILSGSPLMIWDAGGLVGFVAKSVEGNMLNVSWLAQLMISVSAELLSHETAGATSEN